MNLPEIPCHFCGRPTVNTGSKTCGGCFAVEVGIEDFCKSAAGRSRVAEAVAKAVPDRSKTEILRLLDEIYSYAQTIHGEEVREWWEKVRGYVEGVTAIGEVTEPEPVRPCDSNNREEVGERDGRPINRRGEYINSREHDEGYY